MHTFIAAAVQRASRGLRIMKDASRKTLDRLRATPWQTMAYRHWKLLIGIGVGIGAVILLIVIWKIPPWQLGAWLHWDWLIPPLTVAGTVLLRLSSTPERPLLAYFAAGLLIAGSMVGTASAWRNSLARLALQEHAYKELETSTRSLLSLVSQIIVYSSDGWLPSSEDEFFSSHTVTLVCSHLNIEARAPVLPDRDWLTWIVQQTKEAQDQYISVLSAHGSLLDHELIRALTSVRDSSFLTYPSQRVSLQVIDRQKGWQRPPLLCYGAKEITDKFLSQLHTLYTVLWSRTGSKPYPMPSKSHLENQLGKSRFSPDDLAQWNRDHPYAPSGKPPN
jgi:hypothetical protein